MTHTEDLLGLVSDFPFAFSDPEAKRHLHSESGNTPQKHQDSIADDKTQQLLQLTHEFPVAFADSEKPNEVESDNFNAGTNSLATAAAPPELNEKPVVNPRANVPAGYAYALYRQVQTLTWGQVDFHLVYGDRLETIWAITGKSGTEVQSFCEAICRLINLLLLNGVPIPVIVREIRGIRGADSEGLGPNRILGLVDLIGKVLQEAPVQPTTQFSESEASASPPAAGPQTLDNHTANLSKMDRALPLVPESTVLDESIQPGKSQPESLSLILSDAATATSALCPECGAELQQVNGCKGGACIVCGHSSCS